MTEGTVLKLWVTEPPEPAVRQTLERLGRAPDVVRVAVMPDVHLAAGVSNGVAVATERLIYPLAVGGDIGCGFAAVAFHGSAAPLTRRSAAEAMLQALPAAVPVMRHRRRDGLPELREELAPERLSSSALAARATGDGRLELGTLGRGNHFLEFQEDDEGCLWLMAHSGSRAMGQHIAAFHGRRANAAGGGLAWLPADDDTGQAYLRDVAWARAYAAESRLRMLKAAADVVAELVGSEPEWTTLLNTDHNHVQAEQHSGRMLWVHRKGANVAAPGTANVIPGSMGTHTYHVEGRGEADALASSSHGAGRRLSRSAARAQIRRQDLARQLAHVWIDPKTAARLVEEAPAAYRDVDAVMRAQRDLVCIVRCVRPVLCYKGV
ncbi:MAG TPA: RtcB family protein [Phycisphaerae bacterium]|nr:RtcB family protein [Phycisphaerae bacterium]HNU46181.1 RtcB family protein [Phycisphaerae bacterium]